MPVEVLATPRADQQIAQLDRKESKRFNDFLDALAARGRRALGYRLTGSSPIDHICVKHVGDEFRVVVAFESRGRAWILLIGPHDDRDPVLDVYAELYRLLGTRPPPAIRRTKPPCCESAGGMPPILGDALAEILDHAAEVRRCRRRA